MKKALLIITVCVGYTLQSYGQKDSVRQRNPIEKLNISCFGQPEYPRSIELLLFPEAGFGFRFRKDQNQLTRNFSLFTRLEPLGEVKNQNIFRGWNDTAVYFTNYNVRSIETGTRLGYGKCFGFVFGSVNGLISYVETVRTFNDYHVLYRLDSTTGQFEYLNKSNGTWSAYPRPRTYPALGQLPGQNFEYLRLGLAPEVQYRVRLETLTLSANVVYNFQWNFVLKQEGTAPADLTYQIPKYQNSFLLFVSVGVHFKNGLWPSKKNQRSQ